VVGTSVEFLFALLTLLFTVVGISIANSDLDPNLHFNATLVPESYPDPPCTVQNE
jgi:hypothetical protein